jgi:uncharacterized protein YuzE
VKIRYNREADVLLVETSPAAKIDHVEQSGSLITHFTADGAVVLLEILDASRFLASALQAALRGTEVPVMVA